MKKIAQKLSDILDKQDFCLTSEELTTIELAICRLKNYEKAKIPPNKVMALVNFKKYWDELYGQNLEIANWHQNGATEPFDNFYEAALKYGEWSFKR